MHFEASASEATAAAMLAASINYPLRGAVTWKSTVGTNVASDALANLASAGVKGGALIILGEDYGEGASIMQERTHAFAMKSQMWLLDPRPQLPEIVRAVEQGFELSEASNTPVMLMLRIRACHVYGRFMTQGQPPAGVLGRRRAGGTLAGLQPHHPAALDLCAGARKDRAATAGGAAIRRRARAQRVDRRRGGRHRHRSAGRTVQQHAARARTARLRRYVRQQQGAAVRAERHLSAGSLRNGGASAAASARCSSSRRGSPSIIEQAASQILRQARRRRAHRRQGRRCRCTANTPSMCCARAWANSSSSGRRGLRDGASSDGRPDRSPAGAGGEAGGARAAAALGIVHRLSGASVLRGA